MSNMPDQKLKLLYILKFLFTQTDSIHGLTTQQIVNGLAEVAIEAERKSIYRDIKVLQEFGLDIQQNASREWILKTRPLAYEEIALLIDAAQSASFLTESMTDRLVDKLIDLAPTSSASKLRERKVSTGAVKMTNDEILIALETIQQALAARKQVAFRYFKYGADKKRILQKDGDLYRVNPLRLVYTEDRYYLLSYNEHHDNMTPYRVDRMIDTHVTETPITRSDIAEQWIYNDDARFSFGVFGCEVIPMAIEVAAEYVGVLIDKFGIDIDSYPIEDGKVKAYVHAPLSPQFFGWLLQLGTQAKLVGPTNAIEEYREYLSSISSLYE